MKSDKKLTGTLPVLIVLALAFASCELDGPMQPPSYTVKYNGNGSEGSMAATTHVYGTRHSLSPNNFERAGYSFTGWSETPAGEVKYRDRQDNLQKLADKAGAVINLYAQWRPHSYTVTFHPGWTEPWEIDETMEDMEFTYGVAQNLPPNAFTREGYVFTGWYNYDWEDLEFYDGQMVSNLTPEDGGRFTLYARWGINVYTVVYNANGGEGEMAYSVFTCNEQEILRANTFTRTGYTFKGWGREEEESHAEWTDEQSVINLAEPGRTIYLYAQWEGYPYTVVYDANTDDSTGTMEDSRFTYGTPYRLPPNAFTREGYAFTGWARTPDGAVEFHDGLEYDTPMTEEAGGAVTLYAQWAIGKSVTFNAGGGSPAPARQWVVSGGKAVPPAEMTKPNSLFDAWYKEDTFTTKWNFETDTVAEDITLYAKWLAACTVTFNAGGGAPAPQPQTVAQGGKVTPPDAMTNGVLAFYGWYRESTFATEWNFETDTVTSDITLYAKWAVAYTVTFNANYGSPAPATQNLTLGGKVTEPEPMTRAGYAFDAWYSTSTFTDGSKWDFDTGTVTGNTTLYARWVTAVTVTFYANEGTPAPQPQYVMSGGKVTEPEPMTRTGYAFEGWYSTSTFTAASRWNFETGTVRSNTGLYARWIAAYTVTFVANGGTPEPAPQVVTRDGYVNEPAPMTKTGYVFSGWFSDSNFAPASLWSFHTAVTADTNLYARWTPTFTVTFNADGGYPAPVQLNLPSGSTVDRPAAMSKANHDFVNWYKEETHSTAWNFETDTVTGPTTLYAYWLGYYNVAYYANGGTGTMELTKHYINVLQKPLAVNTYTRAGYTFKGWAETAGGDVEYTDRQNVNNLSTTPGETVALYAVWEENSMVTVEGTSLGEKFDWLFNNAQSNTNYVLEAEADENIYAQDFSQWSSGKSGIVIRLVGIDEMRTVGLSLTTGTMFTIPSGITLILDNNITLQGRNTNTVSLVTVNSGGTLVMNSGAVITGNRYGGVNVNGGTFTMNGGTVSGNTTGAGVLVAANGTFTMNNGTVSGNTAVTGAGVLVNSGTFTMNNGTISGNNATNASASGATAYGAGVYVAANGTFTMNNGTISDNTATANVTGNNASYYASAYGGGVFVSGGTFAMTGGTVTRNKLSATRTYATAVTSAYGGGVYVTGSGTFTMTGGTVSANTATAASNDTRGGGVYVADSVFTKTGGTVYGSDGGDNSNSAGTADTNGHAVYAQRTAITALIKYRNRTAGTTINLSFNGTVNPATFGGGPWDY